MSDPVHVGYGKLGNDHLRPTFRAVSLVALLLWLGSVPAGEPVAPTGDAAPSPVVSGTLDKTRCLEAIKHLVAEAAKSGEKIDAWVPILGDAVEKTELAGATNQALSVKWKGNLFQVPWDEIPCRCIADVAKACVQGDVRRALALADFCMAHDLLEKAEEALTLVAEAASPAAREELQSRLKALETLRAAKRSEARPAAGAQAPNQDQPIKVSKPAALPRVELLRDPLFLNGVTQGYANHLPPAERKDCLVRWKAKGVTDAQWMFWEISEQLYFAHNPETPILPRPGAFTWSTANKAKQCLIENGNVRLIFDTGKEWREGGRLNLPDQSGKRPKYADANTTWPHFLIGQHLSSDGNASRIRDDNKLTFEKYGSLRFRADIKLNRLVKSSGWDHRPDYHAANHAIFYIGFQIVPKPNAGGGTCYMLAPAIYSEGDNQHVARALPWVGLDQHGAGFYFWDSQPILKAGDWVSYDIDVKQLIRDGFAAADRKAPKQGKAATRRPEDYVLFCLLIGWEVWGGFDTDVELKNLSLRGAQ